MSTVSAEGRAATLTIASEHGPLHGQLDLLPESCGLVVLAHAAPTLDAREEIVAAVFHNAGLSTLNIDLLSRQEERFADACHNVPLLARRLLDFLALLKNRMLLGEIATQPLGLHGANATSPAVVRVAALRDHDIAAVVCRDGLIDLAGMLYLRSLESPLLLLVEESDEQHLASSRRALQEVHCPHDLKLIPEIGFAASPGFHVAAGDAAQWFARHFASR
ncbi:MAG: hypothetical protein H6R17_1337 [Proteobacteria bacterium]|nr:hypothetical protein [Pseudomonadota bacterium]